MSKAKLSVSESVNPPMLNVLIAVILFAKRLLRLTLPELVNTGVCTDCWMLDRSIPPIFFQLINL